MSRHSSVFASASPAFFESLHRQYLRDPASLDPSWRLVFDAIEDLYGRTEPLAENQSAQADTIRGQGHLFADIDPLHPAADATETLRQLAVAGRPCGDISTLARRYTGTLSMEISHIDDPAIRAWLIAAFESALEPSPTQRKEALALLVKAVEFERFMAVKFPTKKRFGAEGAEAMIPLLRQIIEQAAQAGVTDIVIGTMHRGRLNTMANIMGEPPVELLAKFKGAHPFPVDGPAAADVPYHLGLHSVVPTAFGDVSVRLLPNPSHLEAVNPVAVGRVRAIQDASAGSRAPSQTLGIVLHTDASVIAQGSVAELIQLSGPAGFTTAGTIHVIVNNQIGFTTEIAEARTSRYCTGAWKAIDSAIFHVNGNDPDAVLTAAKLAVGFRQEQKRDAVIDLVCYRGNGHNEIDEPRFTQPLLYQIIDDMPDIAQLYANRLVAADVVNAGFAGGVARATSDELQAAYPAIENFRFNRSGYPDGVWSAYRPGKVEEPATGIPLARLESLLASLSRIPDGFAADPKAARLVRQRAETAGKGIPWATAEALAFGSLLTDGIPVRLSGQDVVRGAFSHRHFALVDTSNGQRHIHLNHLSPDQARFDVINSPLSEYAVFGFEYGYSLESPDRLVIWEAQFGDFANGAQIMLDQFVASGEEKWCQPSGIVVLLPHGLEGQGPEHSSARPERLLHLAAKDNIVIANPSTPANYFHLLRRQMLRKRRKPLIVTSPKTLLRHPAALSPLKDLDVNTGFTPVIASLPKGTVERVILCSGKIAYALEKQRTEIADSKTAILRLEILYPLPEAALLAFSRQWPNARTVWVEEEAANMGAWSALDRCLESVLTRAGARHPTVARLGRAASPSPAGSFHGEHDQDQQALYRAAFAGS